MTTIDDFNAQSPTWCPGCGDWGIGMAIKSSFVNLGFDPSSVCVIFGIGCSGNMNDFLKAYAMHSLHGRAIPNAVGIKLANHKFPVVVVAGDGDTYGEGGNHLIHACRGNHDITVIVYDNGVYGLTTGQVAPTALKGAKSKSTPEGIIEIPVSPISLAISQGATFVAQSFAGDLYHMVDIITKGIQHRGFSLVNILQPCVTFNKINTYQYYIKCAYKLKDDYDRSNYDLALKTASGMISEKFPLGVIYQTKRLAYHEQTARFNDQKALVDRERYVNFEDLISEFE